MFIFKYKVKLNVKLAVELVCCIAYVTIIDLAGAFAKLEKGLFVLSCPSVDLSVRME